MSTYSLVELFLTCGSWQEAQKIADSLLEQKLVACVEFIEIQSKFQWKGELEESKEIKLIMTSIAEHFATIETEVAKLHSYDTFVLKMLPITQISVDAAAWLKESTQK
jgi:uncharacterized protein involved in tolerance to divalent cations